MRADDSKSWRNQNTKDMATEQQQLVRIKPIKNHGVCVSPKCFIVPPPHVKRSCHNHNKKHYQDCIPPPLSPRIEHGDRPTAHRLLAIPSSGQFQAPGGLIAAQGAITSIEKCRKSSTNSSPELHNNHDKRSHSDDALVQSVLTRGSTILNADCFCETWARIKRA